MMPPMDATGIILSAGIGQRMGEPTKDRPKGMLDLGGRPLLAYGIRFLRSVGVSRVVVVAGHHAATVHDFVRGFDPAVEVVDNPDYLKGNLYSVLTALRVVPGAFLLANADHIYSRQIAATVAAAARGITAYCDTDRALGDDDMKVKLDAAGMLAGISKRLVDFDRGYVGLTYCDAASRPLYDAACARVVARLGDKAVAEQVLQELADGGAAVGIGDISGHGWLEVDFPEEFVRAKAAVAKDVARYWTA